MNLRFRLLLEFVAVALLALIVFGIVAYRIALDSADRKEEELLSHIAQSLAISLADSTPPAAMPGRIGQPSLPPVKTPDLLTFVIPSTPSKPPFAIGDTPAPENSHFPVSQLINSNLESGRLESAGKPYLWVTQTIPGTANRVLIAHPRNENPGTFFETLGARFVITGLAILWITVWGSLIISAFVAKRLNQKNDELMQANALLKAEMEERTRAEESTRLALTQKLEAETSNKAKGVFLANMSHELRTPLNSILGFSQMLGIQLTSNGHDDWAEDAKQIYASGTHLLSLINDLLDLSKIEEGKMQFHLDQFEIDPVLHDLQINVTPLVAQNNNQFEIIRQTPRVPCLRISPKSAKSCSTSSATLASLPRTAGYHFRLAAWIKTVRSSLFSALPIPESGWINKPKTVCSSLLNRPTTRPQGNTAAPGLDSPSPNAIAIWLAVP